MSKKPKKGDVAYAFYADINGPEKTKPAKAVYDGELWVSDVGALDRLGYIEEHDWIYFSDRSKKVVAGFIRGYFCIHRVLFENRETDKNIVTRFLGHIHSYLFYCKKGKYKDAKNHKRAIKDDANRLIRGY